MTHRREKLKFQLSPGKCKIKCVNFQNIKNRVYFPIKKTIIGGDDSERIDRT